MATGVDYFWGFALGILAIVIVWLFIKRKTKKEVIIIKDVTYPKEEEGRESGGDRDSPGGERDSQGGTSSERKPIASYEPRTSRDDGIVTDNSEQTGSNGDVQRSNEDKQIPSISSEGTPRKTRKFRIIRRKSTLKD